MTLQNSLKLSMIALFAFGLLVPGAAIPVFGEEPIILSKNFKVTFRDSPSDSFTSFLSPIDYARLEGEDRNDSRWFTSLIDDSTLPPTATFDEIMAKIKIILESAPVPDTTPPVVLVPNDVTIQATSNNPSPVTFSVSASDDVDGAITPSCSPTSGSLFPFFRYEFLTRLIAFFTFLIVCELTFNTLS